MRSWTVLNNPDQYMEPPCSGAVYLGTPGAGGQATEDGTLFKLAQYREQSNRDLWSNPAGQCVWFLSPTGILTLHHLLHANHLYLEAILPILYYGGGLIDLNWWAQHTVFA